MLTLKLMDKKTKSESLKCEHCGKAYKTDAGLQNHLGKCEKKLRFEVRNTMAARLALYAFNEFYRKEMGSDKTKSPKEFENSPYYKGFLRWGDYCVETKAIKPEKFADYLVAHRVRIDLWASDKQYTNYILDLIRTEPVEDALDRSIRCSVKWGESREMRHCDILRYGSPNFLMQEIIAGRLSPWALYGCENGKVFIQNLNRAGLEALWHYINPEDWFEILNTRTDDREFAKTVMKTAGW